MPRLRVWETLQIREVNEKLITTIKSVYKKNVSYVVSKNMKSETFQMKDGLRQGCELSPTLFITFMDDIISKCAKKSRKIMVGYKNLKESHIGESIRR